MLNQTRATNALRKDMGTQQAKTQGPTLGECYGMFQGLPALRGFWPVSSVDQTGAVYDLSEQNRTLSNQGGPAYSVWNDLIPYYDLNGTTQYLNRADEAGLDVTGNLTTGGWFWTDDLTAAQGLSVKGDGVTAANTNWELFFRGDVAGDPVQLNVSSGAGTTTINSTNTPGSGVWFFAVGRYTPSTELAVNLNGIWTRNTTAIPASINNSTAMFALGSRNAAVLLNGRVCLGFLCAWALSDDLVSTLFNRTRPLFGV